MCIGLLSEFKHALKVHNVVIQSQSYLPRIYSISLDVLTVSICSELQVTEPVTKRQQNIVAIAFLKSHRNSYVYSCCHCCLVFKHTKGEKFQKLISVQNNFSNKGQQEGEKDLNMHLYFSPTFLKSKNIFSRGFFLIDSG